MADDPPAGRALHAPLPHALLSDQPNNGNEGIGPNGTSVTWPSSPSPTEGQGAQSENMHQRRRLLLYHPDDREHLSELTCAVRKQIELFVETPKNRSGGGGVADAGGDKPAPSYAEGRAGIRCVWCGTQRDGGLKVGAGGSSKPAPPPRGSVVFPTSSRLVYQSVRNYQRHHMLCCSAMPREVRDQLARLKASTWQRRSSNKCGRYWETSCARLGLMDTQEGLRLRNAVLEGSWTDEMGKAAMASAETMAAARTKAGGKSKTGQPKATEIKPAAVSGLVGGLKRPQVVESGGNKAANGDAPVIVASISTLTDESPSTLSSVNKARQKQVIKGNNSSVTVTLGDGKAVSSISSPAALPTTLDTGPNSFGKKDTEALVTTQQVSKANCTMPSVSQRGLDVSKSGCQKVHPHEKQKLACFGDNGQLALHIALTSAENPGSKEPCSLAPCHPPFSLNATTMKVCPPDTNNALISLAGKEAVIPESNPATAADNLDPIHILQQRQNSSPLSFNKEFPETEYLHQATAQVPLSPAIPISSAAFFEHPDGNSSERSDHGSLRFDADDRSPLYESPSLAESTQETQLVPHSSTTHVQRDMLLERVEFARSLVQAAAEICHFPTGGGASPTPGSERVDPEELRSLGIELYEIFAERQSFNLEGMGVDTEMFGLSMQDRSRGLSDCEGKFNENQQRTKRGRPLKEVKGQCRSFVPLAELGLPSALSCLVSSLLEAKSGDNKVYDSCTSFKEVQEDLELMACHPDKFLFPSTDTMGWAELQLLDMDQDSLYGREEEISKLLGAYDQIIAPERTDSKSSMVLVSGYSGTGKSSLVRKVGREYAQKGARFVSGKFDAMQQMQPLSAIMNALNEYCGLLAHDTGRIDRNRMAIATALGSEGQVLADLIPNLCKILPDVVDGTPSARVVGREAQHRLAFLVRMLLRSTCCRNHPVVLFLDDLQWADTSSLELMRSLVTDSMLEHLLFIGSYRDNEVGPGHPLWECLNGIQRLGSTSITFLCTSSLDIGSVNAFVSDALHAFPRTTQSLSDVVLQKTGGNALFVGELLTSLRDEGLLRFSLSSRKWEWDIENIRARKIGNNVVELMRAKLLRLPSEVHDALRIAAAFGSQCQEDVFRIYDKDPRHSQSTVAALDLAVSEGLVAKVEGPAYRFSHDQIQSAAYLLIPKSEREPFHLHIGRSLWQQSSADEMEAYLFVVVDQLHRGATCITDHNEKVRLIQLSLFAAEKAAAMSAFLPASAYLKSGIALVVEDDWELHRELCFNVHNLCAEMEYILGKFDEVKALLDEVICRGRTLQEKLRAYFTFVRSSGSQSNTSDVFATAIAVLNKLGEAIPSEVTQLEVHQELLKTQALLAAKTEDELRALETITHADKKEAMRFYNLFLMYAYLEGREYFALIACRMLQLSLSHGVCRESAVAFAANGLLLCGLLGDTAGGYRLGKVALSLVDRFNANECLARVYATVYGFVNVWIEPLQSSLPPLKKAIEVGLSTGDNEYAMGSVQLYIGTALGSGMTLGPLMEEMSAYAKQMLEMNQHMAHRITLPTRQFALNLLGKSNDPLRLDGSVMKEGEYLHLAEEKGQGILRPAVYYHRIWLEFLFGEYERAAETATAEISEEITKLNMGRFPMLCNHAFISGLIGLILARRQGGTNWEDTINKTMSQMKKWTLSNPWNCRHKLELMEAEYAYLKGNISEAAQDYARAVDTAAKHRFVHDEALALERAGIFYMETGDNEMASGLFQKAYDCYVRWEAHSKAAHVKRCYL